MVFNYYVHTSDLNCSGCPVARSTGIHSALSCLLLYVVGACLAGCVCEMPFVL